MIWPFENDTSAIIKNMAQKSIAFDKKKNLFCISAIVVAVAMIMMSLLTVQNIIHQNQNEVSGLHQGIFFDITQKDKENLSSEEGVQSIGLSCNIKTVEQNSKELSLIYYDDTMFNLIQILRENIQNNQTKLRLQMPFLKVKMSLPKSILQSS